jgi:hypothetical protein
MAGDGTTPATVLAHAMMQDRRPRLLDGQTMMYRKNSGRSFMQHGINCEGATMNHNVGNIDRAIRITAGVGLIALAAADVIGPWGYIGIVPLLTGVVGICPAYTLLGTSTCSDSGPGTKKN